MSSYFEHNNVRSKFEGFGDQIPEEEMEGVKTVGQAVALVHSKLGLT